MGTPLKLKEGEVVNQEEKDWGKLLRAFCRAFLSQGWSGGWPGAWNYVYKENPWRGSSKGEGGKPLILYKPSYWGEQERWGKMIKSQGNTPQCWWRKRQQELQQQKEKEAMEKKQPGNITERPTTPLPSLQACQPSLLRVRPPPGPSGLEASSPQLTPDSVRRTAAAKTTLLHPQWKVQRELGLPATPTPVKGNWIERKQIVANQREIWTVC